MAVVLKIALQGQTQRLPFDSMPNYDMLEQAIKQAVPQVANYMTKYRDDEGDLCSLVESTFPDFLTTGKATPGGEVLRVEIFPSAPVSAGVQPTLRVRKARAYHQQQQPSKPIWVVDKRDLDELVQQFEDEVAPKTSRKKKKKARKTAEAQLATQDPCEMEEDMQPSIASSCEATSEKDAVDPYDTEEDVQPSIASSCKTTSEKDAAVELFHTIDSVDEQVDTDFGSGTEHAWDVQTDFGDDDTEQMEESVGEQVEEFEQEFEEEYKPLQRSFSCPCISVREDPECVSVAQAWPFVDTESLTADMFGTFQAPMTKENRSLAEVTENTCALGASPGYGYSYQQVVWVPVLMDSTTVCNFAVAATYGMPGSDNLNFPKLDVGPNPDYNVIAT